jgi:hypothetical protein
MGVRFPNICVALLQNVYAEHFRFIAGLDALLLPVDHIASHGIAQMFLFLLNVRCASTEPASGPAFLLSLGAVLSFYGGMIGIVVISTKGASEVLLYEKMLMFSILIDFSSPHSTFFSKYKKFLSFLLLFAAFYFSFSSATILSAADLTFLGNSTLAISNNVSSLKKQAVSVILSNALALAGGVYFLWTLYYESLEFGRHSIASLKAHNVANASKLAIMKCVRISQLKLVSRAFYWSAQVAAMKARKIPNKCSLQQIDDLNERLCSPFHIYAACLQLTLEKVAAIEDAAVNVGFPTCFVKSCFNDTGMFSR